MTPRLVGLFVNDMAQVIQAAGHGLASSGKPIFTCLPTLPSSGGKAQYFRFYPATLQGARHNIGADRGNADRASAHRPAVVD